MEKTMAIRKSANRFKVGETLYLHGCDTGALYGFLQGAFLIRQIKNQSDTGVTFFVSQRASAYAVEFARTDRLTRLRGEPITFLIEELP